jgi:hypothetical protein
MARTQGSGGFEERSFGGSPGTYPMDGYHAHGALGLDPLDWLNEATGNT